MRKNKLVMALALVAITFGLSACGATDTTPSQDEPPYVGGDISQNEPPYDDEGDIGYLLPETLPDTIDDVDWSMFPIIIDGNTGVAADWYTVDGEDFPTHIPLMPVAEGLRVLETVAIDDADPQIITLEGLNGTITFTVGSNEFAVDGNTVELWHSSLLVNDEVYVPISFFRDVFGMGAASWMGGHVHLDTHGADDMH